MTLPSGIDDPLDVLVEGHRVWSFNPGRDGAPEGDGLRVPWHPALRSYLRGAGHVVVRRHVGEEVLFDAEVAFGKSADRVNVTDASGYQLAVDKGGRMQRTFAKTDAGTKELIVEAVQRVQHDLRQECGLEAFLAFGCLLGAVRDGHMIGHDSDADLAYLSAQTHPVDIIRENHAAARRMRQLGWQVVRMSEADFKVWVDLADGRRCGIDVFGGFHVDDTFYLMPNVSAQLDRSSLLPVAPMTLEGREVLGPARPEDLLAATYGAGWRVPDPSFKFEPAVATTRRTNGWMRGRRNHLRHWHEFYKSDAGQALSREHSAFAAWVAERIDPGSPVVDVGAGNGRDAVWFASTGHPATVLEPATNGMRLARQNASQHHVSLEHRGVNFNEVRSPLLLAARLTRREQVPHLHARFLLDALTHHARHAFWRFAAVVQRTGGRTFLEFRTPASAGERTTYPDHFRQYLDPDEVVAEIRRYGGTVVEREQGRGRAVLGREDPDVCRLVIRWGGPRTAAPEEHPKGHEARLHAVAREVQESRGQHQRLVDLLDLVTGVLVPASDPDDPRLAEVLARLRALLPDVGPDAGPAGA
ncbi:class I SAM-dependent methyltransferase [Nocardioides guangzhouensis]|uniref:Class I SAM-dependent methyltransferase n=1 Tax=Nocardioides guangzhouensis TaxID=2497878 RepID=A0A4Q4Z6R8_9ACTN|nr:DUF6752 domain-containing protein [Nocardioides guangzhouensis]RYP83433.1 class I SAM-dependent methyltransferase [Nocardioides guangzhouensis]